MMTEEHDTKCWVLLSVGSLGLHAHEAGLGVRKDVLKKALTKLSPEGPAGVCTMVGMTSP